MPDGEGLRLHHARCGVREIAPAQQMHVGRYGCRVCSGVIHDPLQRAMVAIVCEPERG